MQRLDVVALRAHSSDERVHLRHPVLARTADWQVQFKIPAARAVEWNEYGQRFKRSGVIVPTANRICVRRPS
jgi:hypothetical protein